jgi:hypothetical protein
LVSLKKKFPIFATSNYTQSLGGEIKWIKLNLNGESVLIVGNFGVISANIAPEFQKTGTWYDFFGKKTLSVTATSQSIALTPGEYKLYSTQNFGSTITGIVENHTYLNDIQISPNPAGDYIRVISAKGTDRVEIFTLTGSKVKEFKLTNFQNEDNEFYVGDLHSGIYLLKVHNTDGQTIVKKVIKKP